MASLPEAVLELDMDPVVSRIYVGGRGEGEGHSDDARRRQVQVDRAEDPGSGRVAGPDEDLLYTNGLIAPRKEDGEGAPEAEAVVLLSPGLGAARRKGVLHPGDVLARADTDLVAESVRDEGEAVHVVGEVADREAPLGAFPDDVLLEYVRPLPPYLGRDLIDTKKVAPALFGVEEEVDVALGPGDVAPELGRGRPLGPGRPRPGHELPCLGHIPPLSPCPLSGQGELTRAGTERDREGRDGDEEHQAERWAEQNDGPGSPRNERTSGISLRYPVRYMEGCESPRGPAGPTGRLQWKSAPR